MIVDGTTARLSVLVAVDMLAADVLAATGNVGVPESAFNEVVLPLVSEKEIEVDLLIADATDSTLDSTLDRDAISVRAIPVSPAVAAILLGCDAMDDA